MEFLTLHFSTVLLGSSLTSLCPSPCRLVFRNYQQILALTFAITELNKDPTLLPNTTLGFCIYDYRNSARRGLVSTLSLLSTRGQMCPNYKCDRRDKLFSVLGGFNSESSRQMASILGLLKIPQVRGLMWAPMWGFCRIQEHRD